MIEHGPYATALVLATSFDAYFLHGEYTMRAVQLAAWRVDWLH